MSPFFEEGETRVKICGVTRPGDAEAVVEAGADAIGFNLWPGSKRFVALESIAEWAGRLPVTRIAVVVDLSAEELERVVGGGLFHAVQFHGKETPLTCAASGARTWIKAMQAESKSRLQELDAYQTEHVLIDAHVPGQLGGTGAEADWNLVADFRKAHPGKRVILAGGLTPANVAAAIETTGVPAVDTAGGVESAPGIKDPAKVRDFVAAVKRR